MYDEDDDKCDGIATFFQRRPAKINIDDSKKDNENVTTLR